MVEKCKECEDDRALFYDSFDTGLPFTEIEISDNRKIRKFTEDTPEHLLKWHADDEDRVIRAFKMTDWLFQFDNELPIKLSMHTYITIQKGRIHRLIKGDKDLFVEIMLPTQSK